MTKCEEHSAVAFRASVATLIQEYRTISSTDSPKKGERVWFGVDFSAILMPAKKSALWSARTRGAVTLELCRSNKRTGIVADSLVWRPIWVENFMRVVGRRMLLRGENAGTPVWASRFGRELGEMG